MTEQILHNLRESKKHLHIALKYASMAEQGIFLDDLLSEHDDCIMRADGLFTAIKRAISGVQDDIDLQNQKLIKGFIVEMKTKYIGVVK